MRNPRKLLKSLLLRSAVIQTRIDDAMKARSPDMLQILMLKKQRLKVKDMIMALQRRVRRRKRTLVQG